jgi:hypothetical protein
LRHYWWLHVRSFVMEYISGCDTCQCNKAGVHQNVGLAPNDVSEGLWQVVGQDLITGLPNVKGFNAIAMFVDHYGKQVHIVPTTDKVDLDGIAGIHHCSIFQLHGIPWKFILDQGPQFASYVMCGSWDHNGLSFTGKRTDGAYELQICDLPLHVL